MSSTTEFLNNSVLLVGIGNAISYYCAGALTFVLFYGTDISGHYVSIISLLTDNVIYRYFCAPVCPINLGLLVRTVLSNFKTTLMIFFLRKNKQSHRARIWMFLISTTNFLLSTAFAAAQIATIRIYIYSTLLGYQDMPLMKRLSLQHGQLEDVTLVILWTGSFQVRFFILDSLNCLTTMHELLHF